MAPIAFTDRRTDSKATDSATQRENAFALGTSLVRYLFADTFDTVPNVGNSAACPVDNVLACSSGPVGHALSSAARAKRQSAGHSHE